MSTARPSSRLSIARSAPSFILAPAHAVEVNRRCLVGAWAWDFARAAATRSALCAVLVVVLRCVGCFSCLNGTDRSFCGLRQRARQRRPPATPASDARQRRPPAGHTKPRLDSKPAGDVRCRSLMPPVKTTAHHGRIYRGTQRKRAFCCVRRSCLATWEFRPSPERAGRALRAVRGDIGRAHGRQRAGHC
jgi:hypothetical protein